MDDTLRPLLLGLGILLIATGAGLALCFGYVTYQTLFHPETSPLMNFLLQKAGTLAPDPILTATIDGRIATYRIPDSLKVYGICAVAIFGFGVLVNVARCMSDAGVHILKMLWTADVK